MPDFRPGDVVVIREWDDMEEEFGLNEYGNINCNKFFVEDMRDLCGREFTLESVDYDGVVFLEETREFHFSTDMIRPIGWSSPCAEEINVDDFFAVLNG